MKQNANFEADVVKNPNFPRVPWSCSLGLLSLLEYQMHININLVFSVNGLLLSYLSGFPQFRPNIVIPLRHETYQGAKQCYMLFMKIFHCDFRPWYFYFPIE